MTNENHDDDAHFESPGLGAGFLIEGSGEHLPVSVVLTNMMVDERQPRRAMGPFNSRWVQWMVMAMLACLVLQGCTVQMWEELTEEGQTGGEVDPGFIALAILATPVTLAIDATILCLYICANMPHH